jgi:hypothetical protein
MAAREEWQKPIDENNIDYMVKVIGKVQKEDLRFGRYFEDKDILSLVLADNRIYEEVVNQLTGMNRNILLAARIPASSPKRYQALVEHVCELEPHHFSAIQVFSDIYTVASITRDRGEMCNDANALTRYQELIDGDPASEYPPAQLGLRGQFDLENNMVAGEVLRKLGIVTQEEFDAKANATTVKQDSATQSLFGCAGCGGIYPASEATRAIFDQHTSAERVCQTCLQNLKDQGRLVSVVEPAAAQPPGQPVTSAPVTMPAPTGTPITPTPVYAPVRPAPATAAQVTCPVCGRQNAPNARFCNYCGTPLKPTKQLCQQCGKELPAGAKFCHECGRPVTPHQATFQQVEQMVQRGTGQVIAPQVIAPQVITPVTIPDKATLLKQTVQNRIREEQEKLSSSGKNEGK